MKKKTLYITVFLSITIFFYFILNTEAVKYNNKDNDYYPELNSVVALEALSAIKKASKKIFYNFYDNYRLYEWKNGDNVGKKKDKVDTDNDKNKYYENKISNNSNFIDKIPKKDIQYKESSEFRVSDIENSFNYARLHDNIIFNKKISLPRQSVWDKMSFYEKGLYLINAERQARDIISFEAVSNKVSEISQKYSKDLLNNGYFDHERKSDRASPWDRLEEDKDIRNYQDWYQYGENLYASSYIGGDQIVIAIYDWIYNDSISHWGHREFILSSGLKNNSGNKYSEGLIGFGISTGKYSLFDSGLGTIIVMNAFDPSEEWFEKNMIYVDTSKSNIKK